MPLLHTTWYLRLGECETSFQKHKSAPKLENNSLSLNKAERETLLFLDRIHCYLMTYETEAQPDHGLLKDESVWTSLAAQWIRICLPMQGTWVQPLDQEDSPGLGAIKPMGHNYWASALGACMPQRLKPSCLEPLLHNKRSHHNEKPSHCYQQ